MLNPFFQNVDPFTIEKILSKIDIENKENFKKDKIYNVADLVNKTAFGLAIWAGAKMDSENA